MKRPLISIILPTYNHASFLEKAIGSVLSQDYANWELVIIDNHSEDSTDKVIASFSDKRIRVLKIHNDGVIAASRNLGIVHSNGEWIAFLDSDDIWYYNKLSIVIDFINKNNQYDVISTDEYTVIKKSGKRIQLRHGPCKKIFYKDMLINGNKLSTSATVVRSSFIKERSIFFNEYKSYITVEDYDFWLNLARHGANFFFIQEYLGEYTIHSSNSSNQLVRHHLNLGHLLHDHVFNIQKFDPRPDKLWSKLELRLKLLESSRKYSDRNYFSSLSCLFIAFLQNPIYFIKVFSRFTFRKMFL